MSKQIHHNVLLAIAACLLLVSCGESSQPDDVQTATPPPPILGGDPQPAPTAPATSPATTASTGSDVPLHDSTPQEAFQTFVDRLAAFDIAGAVELCDPAHANTEKIVSIATNMQKAATESGMAYDTLAQMMLQGIESVTFEVSEQTDDTAIVRITAPIDKTYELVRLDSNWRIRVADDTAPFPHQ